MLTYEQARQIAIEHTSVCEEPSRIHEGGEHRLILRGGDVSDQVAVDLGGNPTRDLANRGRAALADVLASLLVEASR